MSTDPQYLDPAWIDTADERAQRIGADFFAESGDAMPRDLSKWGDHEDMPLISDVFELATGHTYPADLNTATLDTLELIDSVGDNFELGYYRAALRASVGTDLLPAVVAWCDSNVPGLSHKAIQAETGLSAVAVQQYAKGE